MKSVVGLLSFCSILFLLAGCLGTNEDNFSLLGQRDSGNLNTQPFLQDGKNSNGSGNVAAANLPSDSSSSGSSNSSQGTSSAPSNSGGNSTNPGVAFGSSSSSGGASSSSGGTPGFRGSSSSGSSSSNSGSAAVGSSSSSSGGSLVSTSGTSNASSSSSSGGSSSGSSGSSGASASSSGGSVASSNNSGSSESPSSPSPACTLGDKAAVVNAGQSIDLYWNSSNTSLTFTVSDQNGNSTGVGTVTKTGDLSASYTAPSTNDQFIAAVAGQNAQGESATCFVQVVPQGRIGVEDDGNTNGLRGTVYDVSGYCTRTGVPSSQCIANRYDGGSSSSPAYVPNGILPNSILSGLTAAQKIVTGNLNLPNTRFTLGFPGVSNLIEWFVIDFEGNITVPTPANGSTAPQQYYFAEACDDACNVIINGTRVVDNDGIHPITTATGSISLAPGTYPIQVYYYQGPKYYIALQLSWKVGTNTTYSIVPASAFSSPTL